MYISLIFYYIPKRRYIMIKPQKGNLFSNVVMSVLFFANSHYYIKKRENKHKTFSRFLFSFFLFFYYNFHINENVIELN